MLAASTLVGVAAFEAGPAAASPIAHVRSGGQFADAAARFRATGGTIVLRAARFENLTLGPRGRARLTIRGTPNASVGHVLLDRTRAVRLVGLRLTPRRRDAGLEAVGARNVLIERTVVTAAGTRFRATVRLMRTRGVTIARSRFSRCGDRAVCILTGRSSHLRILDSRFNDCYGCDFIRGNFGRRLVIRGNRFDRALVGRCGTNPYRCNHQDLIELHVGTGLIIERNRFGVFELPGGGQVALFGAVNDVRIRNNVFLRTDPRAPGVVAPVGINLGGWGAQPRRVVIANNTILSGRSHWRGYATSIRLRGGYNFMRRADRPVIANNVIALAATPRVLCRGARLVVRNVIERGAPCSATDAFGSAALDATGRPTVASTLAIDTGAPRWAPRFDFRGRRRDARPDVGAFEYVAPSAP